MTGQHLPVSIWLRTPPTGDIYLDAHIWEEFVDWIRPADNVDTRRVENLVDGNWRVYVFREQLNQIFGQNYRRDRALEEMGIQVVQANGNGCITARDELFIDEVMRVYFSAEDPTLARRNAVFLLLARRASREPWASLLTLHRSFWRVPNVNTFYLDNKPLQGNVDLPAAFDFLNDFNIHPAIADVVRERLPGRDYGHIMLDALIGFRDHVRQKSGLTGDGRNLMEQAFGSTPPAIALNPLTDPNQRGSQQNEQKGFKDIAVGVMTGLRNPLTHEGGGSPFAQSRYPDRKTLFKYLSFLSLLCERSDGPLP